MTSATCHSSNAYTGFHRHLYTLCLSLLPCPGLCPWPLHTGLPAQHTAWHRARPSSSRTTQPRQQHLHLDWMAPSSPPTSNQSQHDVTCPPNPLQLHLLLPTPNATPLIWATTISHRNHCHSRLISFPCYTPPPMGSLYNTIRRWGALPLSPPSPLAALRITPTPQGG